jgi:hypothetical protein
MKTQIVRTTTAAAVTLLLLANPAWVVAAPPAAPPPGPPPPTEPPPEPKPKKVFVFPGGNPVEFIMAMDHHFRTRLHEILSVPHALVHAQVPKMRLTAESPTEPLTVYNRLGDPFLGRWVWEGAIDPGTNVQVLTLVPDKAVAGSLQKSGARVKAIALAGVPKSKWHVLQEDIDAARKVASGQADKQSGSAPDGEIHIQPTSKVLIVSGSDDFIEMVESVVAAHRANTELEAGKVSSPDEKPVEK